MSSTALSTRRTKVKTPSAKSVGNTTSANTRKVSPVAEICATNPSDTSDAESEPRYIAARAELSAIVEPRAPCNVKCSVVSVVRSACRSTSFATDTTSTSGGDAPPSTGRCVGSVSRRDRRRLELLLGSAARPAPRKPRVAYSHNSSGNMVAAELGIVDALTHGASRGRQRHVPAESTVEREDKKGVNRCVNS